MAPGSAESSWVTTSPKLTCPIRAPSARMSADARRASVTVAHVVKIALRAARMTSMTVMIASVCSSRVTSGSAKPPAVSDVDAPSLLSTSAWKDSTATMPMTVTATLAADSTARRGLRVASRTPNRAATGSREERLHARSGAGAGAQRR